MSWAEAIAWVAVLIGLIFFILGEDILDHAKQRRKDKYKHEEKMAELNRSSK